MKKLLVLLLMVSSSITFAQNGGQGNANDAMRVWFKDPTHVIIKNLLTCTSTVEVKDGSTFTIPAGDSIIIPGTLGFRARTTKGCGQFDKGWIEMDVYLLLTFSDFKASLNDGLLKVYWKINDNSSTSGYEIQGSKDGLVWYKIDKLSYNSTGEYRFDKNISGLWVLGGSLFGFLLFGFRNRLLATIFGVVFLISCTKTTQDLNKKTNIEYIRIMQITKDGQVDYSKVIKL